MYSTLVSVALFSALAIQGALAEFTVETPTITQCEPVQIKWDNTGAKSFNVAIVPSANPCESILADLGDHSINHITWTANLAAGQKVMLSVLDSNDEEGWSGEITVKDGGNSSCLPGASSSKSASHSSTASSTAATGTTLVVNPAAGPSSHTSAPAAPSSTDGATAVGAAGAGLVGNAEQNGAFSVRFSSPSVVLGALVAVAALAF